jgi:hypothetical protein
MLHEHHVIYSFRYYPRFHITAVGFGTYYSRIRGHYCTRVPRDPEPKMTALTRPAVIYPTDQPEPRMTVLARANRNLPRTTERQYRVARLTQSLETENYGRGFRGARHEEWLCWRGPAAIYLDRPKDI